MFRRGAQAVVLGAVMVVMMGAGQSRFERLGHEMICQCGCSQVLLDCNHVGCPVSPVMMSELQAQLASGVGDTAVLNWFTGKYGAVVLAAPIRGGFDRVAWIVPIAAFLLATVGTAVLVWVWKRRGGELTPVNGSAGVAAGTLEDAAMRERIRRETEYR